MRRQVKQVFLGVSVSEGAGVLLRRVFGYPEAALFDPFLMLDDFRSDIPEHYLKGFPWHPHRGIETITYVLAGEVDHKDSMGNEGTIGAGDVQWMTAGSGIIHQEMPRGDAGGAMHGFQLWANLPARDKMMAPRYRGITVAEIPEVSLPGGVRARIIAGTVGGVRGPVRDVVIDPEYLDCTVPAGTEYVHETSRGHTAFLYVIGGEGQVGDTAVANRTVVLFGDGDELAVRAGQGEMRLLLFTGKPLGEPIAWRGPIVMNTDEELRVAFEEFRAGTFVK